MHWFSGLVCGLGHASGLGSGAELNPRCLKLQSPTKEVCGFGRGSEFSTGTELYPRMSKMPSLLSIGNGLGPRSGSITGTVLFLRISKMQSISIPNILIPNSTEPSSILKIKKIWPF